MDNFHNMEVSIIIHVEMFDLCLRPIRYLKMKERKKTTSIGQDSVILKIMSMDWLD